MRLIRAAHISFCLAVGSIYGSDAGAQTSATGVDDVKLPRSTRALGDYLANTVWNLEGGGIFRFRGDETMVMPWHGFQWKPTSARSARMFTDDWKWEIKFSEDMKTLEVPGRYKGTQVKRLISAVDDKGLEEILTKNKWKRVSKKESYSIGFAKHGKMIDQRGGWKAWAIYKGLLILKGTRKGKEIRDEYMLFEDKKPYILKWADGGDSTPKLKQQ